MYNTDLQHAALRIHSEAASVVPYAYPQVFVESDQEILVVIHQKYLSLVFDTGRPRFDYANE